MSSRARALMLSCIKRVERVRPDIYETCFQTLTPDDQFWRDLAELEDRFVARLEGAGSIMKARNLEAAFLRDFRSRCMEARKRGQLARGGNQASGPPTARSSGGEDLPDP